MKKITGSLIDIREIDDTYCKLFFDIDEIIGEDEISELLISKRVVADFLGLNEEKLDEFLRHPARKEMLKESPKEIEVRARHGFNAKLNLPQE